jgi:hypothetical protein
MRTFGRYDQVEPVQECLSISAGWRAVAGTQHLHEEGTTPSRGEIPARAEEEPVIGIFAKPNSKKILILVFISVTRNGKTSIVYYRTLSFFALRLKKKRKFAFFHFFKNKITIEPVRFASILKFFNVNMFALASK